MGSIIETYFDGGADPYLIDSVGRIAFTKPAVADTFHLATDPRQQTTVYQPLPKEKKPAPVPGVEPAKQPVAAEKEPELVENPWQKETPKQPDSVKLQVSKPVVPETLPVIKVSPPTAAPRPEIIQAPEVSPPPEIKPAPPTIEEKFVRRRNVVNTTIPVTGDTVVFKFYDNAEVDGDSISIFLNGKMLYTHIRLTDKGYGIKVPVNSLQTGDNELVMVAENLGSIPPNTAYMEAWSGGKRYTARMESTELSSASIRLKKE